MPDDVQLLKLACTIQLAHESTFLFTGFACLANYQIKCVTALYVIIHCVNKPIYTKRAGIIWGARGYVCCVH